MYIVHGIHVLCPYVSNVEHGIIWLFAYIALNNMEIRYSEFGKILFKASFIIWRKSLCCVALWHTSGCNTMKRKPLHHIIQVIKTFQRNEQLIFRNDNGLKRTGTRWLLFSVNFQTYFSQLPPYISPLIISSTYLGW